MEIRPSGLHATAKKPRKRPATHSLLKITLLLSKIWEFNLSVMPCLRIHVALRCNGFCRCVLNTKIHVERTKLSRLENKTEYDLRLLFFVNVVVVK